MKHKQEYSSKNTSVNSARLPVVYSKIESLVDLTSVKSILDVGGGKFDNASDFMKDAFDIDVFIFDKYNRSEEHNKQLLSYLNESKVDVSIVSNVLNVIKEDEFKLEVLVTAINATKHNGVVLIKIYEGNKTGIGAVSKLDCWQENKRSKDYDNLFKTHPRVKNVLYKHGFVTLLLDK